MKILVTGSAGFIGFHLVKKLLDRGDRVVGIDNINHYYDPQLKYARLAQTGISPDAQQWHRPVASSIYPGYTFVRMNLEDREQLDRLFAREQFSRVCHLAAQAGVRYSLENPHTYISSNIVGFLNILEACRHNNIRHLVYASSSSVYGNNTKMPFSTSDNVDHPISLYAATKKSNELMAHTYSHLFGLPATGLRFFTVYGPWGRPDMALFLFTKAILENKPIKVFNNGNMVRDFTYIDDIVEGVVRILDHPPGGTVKMHSAESIEHRSNEQRTTNNELQTANNELRTANNELRTTNWSAAEILPQQDNKLKRSGNPALAGQQTPYKIYNIGNSNTDNSFSVPPPGGMRQQGKDSVKDGAEGGHITSAPYKVYNIGNSSPVALMDYISAIETRLGRTAEKIYLPMQPGDVPRTEADVSNLVSDLGYKPATTVEEGIGRFLEWYEEYFKIKKYNYAPHYQSSEI